MFKRVNLQFCGVFFPIHNDFVFFFLLDLPQVGVYGLTIQKQCDIKVKCVIVNKEGAWVFDPSGILNSIDNFMNKYSTFIPPWEDFSNMQ